MHAGYGGPVRVLPGPVLLAGVADGPALAAHRSRWPDPGRMSAARLLDLLARVEVAGRGGAGFPFGRKLATALRSGRRRELVVNAAESEPGSAKDSALMIGAPHLVLDGADLVAGALGTGTVLLVLPGARPAVRHALEAAVTERPGRYEISLTTGGFVGGQESAVLQLLAGRPNVPVTSWQPAAVSGLRGRPTLLANAETFAQVAALRRLGPEGYRRLGTGSEPGTTLLTVAGDTANGTVLEVPFGTGLGEVLATCGYGGQEATLVGGYHGGWLAAGAAPGVAVSRVVLARAGAPLGAGVVLPLPPGWCPVERTARIVGYLAGQSARQCGPCHLGLPALAAALAGLALPAGSPSAGSALAGSAQRVAELAGLVTGRGACAHPDGTARLAASLLRTFPGEIEAHRHGGCPARAVPGAAVPVPPFTRSRRGRRAATP